MDEINQSSEVNQIVNSIKEEISSPEPSTNRIINDFYDLRNLLWKKLSEFYDIVGETFKLDPEFFMGPIYEGTRFFHNRDMAKYIIEKFCLYDGEQILYEFQGEIKQVEGIAKKISVSVKGGTIFVTNHRIIAQGTANITGPRLHAYSLLGRWGILIGSLIDRESSKMDISAVRLLDASLEQELPCYGYQFRRKNLVLLEKMSKGVRYFVVSDNVQNINDFSTLKKRELRKATTTITIMLSRE